MSGKRSKRRRRRRSRALFRAFGRLSALAAAVLLFLYVFQLQSLLIRGNMHVSTDEIKSVVLTAPTLGNTILTKLFNTNRSIPGSGFIDRIDASIQDRGTVKIQVTEHRFVGVLHEAETYWYIMPNGTAQASAKKRAAGEQLPLIEGLELNASVTLGSVLPISGTRPFVLLDSLKSQTELYGIVPETVVFREDGSMALMYKDVTVLIGDGTNLDGRVRELAGILKKMDGAYSGTLHLENFERSGSPIVFDKN